MIRPIDLQATILSGQTAAAAQRAEEGPRIDAQAAQAAFVAGQTRRDESVAATGEALPNRIGVKPKEREAGDGRSRKDAPRTPFEQVVDDVAAASDDAPHIVDFTA